MRNIDRIRAMDAEQLAGFLVENGAPVPTEFCDIVCTGMARKGNVYPVTISSEILQKAVENTTNMCIEAVEMIE